MFYGSNMFCFLGFRFFMLLDSEVLGEFIFLSVRKLGCVSVFWWFLVKVRGNVNFILELFRGN